MNTRIIKILFLIFVLFPFVSFSETVTFKSGKTVEGKIVEKTEKYIKVDIGGVVITYYNDEIENISANNNVIVVDNQPADLLNVKINPMIKLDFKTKEDIYRMRKDYVSQYKQLTNENYSPSESVFGQIQDGKPWWGILGLSYYGPGSRGIEGASEESRFLINPFLLVGLDAGHGIIVDDKNLSPIPIFPEPKSLSWRIDRFLAKVTYNVTDFWRKQKKYHDSQAEQHNLTLIAYNARDLGFNYLAIIPDKSTNVYSTYSQGNVVSIQQFIHCGGSCGYPGGCNNMSPEQPELRIKVEDVPATAYIKLWRNNPKDASQAADMVFIIEMI